MDQCHDLLLHTCRMMLHISILKRIRTQWALLVFGMLPLKSNCSSRNNDSSKKKWKRKRTLQSLMLPKGMKMLVQEM